MCLGSSKKKRSLFTLLFSNKPLLKTPGPLSPWVCATLSTALTAAQQSRMRLPRAGCPLTWSFGVGCLPAHPKSVISRCFYVQLKQWLVCLVVSCLLKIVTESLIYNLHRAFPVIRCRISEVGYISWAEFFSCAYLTCPRSESLKNFEYQSLEIFLFLSFIWGGSLQTDPW